MKVHPKGYLKKKFYLPEESTVQSVSGSACTATQYCISKCTVRLYCKTPKHNIGKLQYRNIEVMRVTYSSFAGVRFIRNGFGPIKTR